ANVSQRATESIASLKRLPADGLIHRPLQIIKGNLAPGGHFLDFLSRLIHRLRQRLSCWNSVLFQLHERIAHDLAAINRLGVDRRNISKGLISERRGVADRLKNASQFLTGLNATGERHSGSVRSLGRTE